MLAKPEKVTSLHGRFSLKTGGYSLCASHHGRDWVVYRFPSDHPLAPSPDDKVLTGTWLKIKCVDNGEKQGGLC